MRFTPQATGARTGTLTVTEESGTQYQVTMTQTGTAPALTLSVNNVSFAVQAVGARSGGQAVTLTNTGVGDLSFTSIIAYGDFGQSNDCPLTLGAGASCTLTVTSRPLSAGNRVGAVQIIDDAPGSPRVIALSGLGQ